MIPNVNTEMQEEIKTTGEYKYVGKYFKKLIITLIVMSFGV